MYAFEIQGSVEFFLGYLTPHGPDGTLVTVKKKSPEAVKRAAKLSKKSPQPSNENGG